VVEGGITAFHHTKPLSCEDPDHLYQITNRLMKKTLLFLCTGNYYRSRFAEILFNSRAARSEIDWQATSRGLATELISRNDGPISLYAINGLKDRGIIIGNDIRYPIQLEEADLHQANRVIALYEPEHRPYLESRYPGWADRIEYWNIPDRDLAPTYQALATIESNVLELIAELTKSKTGP
jgi:protein-tyrosine phosphatase